MEWINFPSIPLILEKSYIWDILQMLFDAEW